MRLHVPSLPWTQTTPAYLSCAYTQKVVKFCRMMMSLGHEVILYAGVDNEAPCTEHHVVVPEDDRLLWYGGERWLPTQHARISWDPLTPPWTTMNSRVVELMRQGTLVDEHADVICLISGFCQNDIALAWPDTQVAEWGIGYEGVVPNAHWCFESYAWMHYVYAKQGMVNGRWYDVVIPNSFDPADFRLGDGDGGYLLYLGRMVYRKGPLVAAQIAQRLGMHLVCAGPGADKVMGGGWRSEEEWVQGDHITYVGTVDAAHRADLLAGAAALLAPTLYIEPFGGVAVEAMLSGTPVVATPWGAFPETVRPGVSGYLFSTLAEGTAAVQAALELDRVGVRRWANRYSIWNVRDEYQRWLENVTGLRGEGWEAQAPEESWDPAAPAGVNV